MRNVVDNALVVPVGQPELLRAFTLRGVHDDFEDDLLLGTARHAGVDYVVTGSSRLARRSPVPCVDAAGALRLARR